MAAHEPAAGDAAIENILEPNTLTLFLYFVVPGFVAIKVFDLLIPTERRDFGAALIEVVSYSLTNWVLFAWLLAEHDSTNPAVLDFSSGFRRIVYVFFTPAVLALLVYFLRNTGGVRRALRKVGVNVLSPMPTAWDAFFSRRDASYIVFHLKSKELVGALFDRQSFSTAWPGPQEVYVEQLWVINPVTRQFIKPVANTKGAIIKLDDCDFIEMFAGTPPLPIQGTP
ncbi:MAG: DUF6338 family protein [Chloroflexota bacterium]